MIQKVSPKGKDHPAEVRSFRADAGEVVHSGAPDIAGGRPGGRGDEDRVCPGGRTLWPAALPR